MNEQAGERDPPRPPIALHPTPAQLQELSPALLQRLAEQQAQEMALRGDQARLRRQELEAAYRYAEHALAAQTRDRQDARTERRRARRDRLFAVALTVVGLLAFFVVLLGMGKDTFARETLQAVIYLVTGGAGGYFAGKAQRQAPVPEPG